MAREIKFRYYWQHETSEIWHSDYSLDEIEKEDARAFQSEHSRDLIAKVQYTGLHDKNGREIYEGDILKLQANDFKMKQKWTGVIEFGNPNSEYNWGWQLKPVGNDNVNPAILLWVETEMPNVSCEVIGNIYENPELLKV